MIDHIGIEISNYEKSKFFYELALKTLGYELLMEIKGFAGFGCKEDKGPIASFWIHAGNNPTHTTHIAFNTKSRSIVDAFYEAAIKAGGTDNGKPGIREHYHENYYGAFILDPDGYNIEAVCHEPV